jgi:hypothetical protein
MVSSGMLRHVALVRTYVSKELSTSFLPILVSLMKETLSSSETSVLTRATWRNIPEDTFNILISLIEVSHVIRDYFNIYPTYLRVENAMQNM